MPSSAALQCGTDCNHATTGMRWPGGTGQPTLSMAHRLAKYSVWSDRDLQRRQRIAVLVAFLNLLNSACVGRANTFWDRSGSIFERFIRNVVAADKLAGAGPGEITVCLDLRYALGLTR